MKQGARVTMPGGRPIRPEALRRLSAVLLLALLALAAMLVASGRSARAAPDPAHMQIAVMENGSYDPVVVGDSAPPTPPTPTLTPTATRSANRQPIYVRGVFGKDTSASGSALIAATGFNTVMTDPYRQLLDPLAAQGLKGIVWLGAWKNAPACNFERDDATIRSQVVPIAGHPAILAYYLGDEPRVTECPNAPAMFRQRSELIHSLDPGSLTFTVIQAYENGVSHDYAPWRDVVDVVGFDVYPCSRASSTCRLGDIDSAITDIQNAGVSPYWAVIQDFQDCYYRLPTPAELRGQFDHWARSAMSGYLVFSWNYQAAGNSCGGTSLESHPDNVNQLRAENARLFVPQSVRPTPAAARAASNSIGSEAALAATLLVCVGVAMMAARRRRHDH